MPNTFWYPWNNLVPRVSLLCLPPGWSRDHLSIQNRRVGGYSSTFGREETLLPHPSSRFFYHPDSGWSRDQPQLGSLFQPLREAEKRDPGNEVAHGVWICACAHVQMRKSEADQTVQGINIILSKTSIGITFRRAFLNAHTNYDTTEGSSCFIVKFKSTRLWPCLY